ncbi:MAG: GNAT family N-acetyltransferase [Deltaproteobacteria bacterium]|nr:GNAT family N-acetyltransferase [Deltaproteobacteria bacterium]
MKTRIRRARKDDARAIARVHVASWQHAYWDLLSKDYLRSLTVSDLTRSWRRRLSVPPPGEELWVTVTDEAVIAFCAAGPARDNRAWDGYAGEITYLYVHPSMVGRGVGTALMGRALGKLERRGCVWAEVAVLEGNHRARRFYDALGMRFGGARWVDARFEVPVIRHERALNAVVDFDSFRVESAR